MPELHPASFEALRVHVWPGNGRELRNVVERALIFHDRGPLVVRPPTSSLMHVESAGTGMTLELDLSLEEVERRYLGAFLRAHPASDQADLAARLGISRKTLWDKRRRYGL